MPNNLIKLLDKLFSHLKEGFEESANEPSAGQRTYGQVGLRSNG